MSDINIQPGTWIKVFDKDVSGSFRLVGFKARVKRAVVMPTEITGVTIKAMDDDISPRMHWEPELGNLYNMYVYNSGRDSGLIEVDV